MLRLGPILTLLSRSGIPIKCVSFLISVIINFIVSAVSYIKSRRARDVFSSTAIIGIMLHNETKHDSKVECAFFLMKIGSCFSRGSSLCVNSV